MSAAEQLPTRERGTAHGAQVRNALSKYFAEIQHAARLVGAERVEQPPIPLALSERPAAYAQYTDVTDIGLTQVESGLFLLDLMRNPGARTTKTPASLLMVARAAEHARRTGERVLIVTPTSGNKGTALRDAVARAHATGLAKPDQVRIVTVVPTASREKLRDCPLSADEDSRAANPLILASVEQPSDVKQLTMSAARDQAQAVFDATGFRLWFTLDLDNYRIADSIRAFAESELLPITSTSRRRVHAHAVSSAFGLLGYHLGHRLLTEALPDRPVPDRHPGFLLVQQLATADMVTSLLGTEVPPYRRDPASGLFHQSARPEFPAVTDDPRESIDPTFYTKQPPTSPQVNRIIARHGGGGIVVSRRECLDHFDTVRSIAAAASIRLPADPARIKEWSLVKVLTGVLLARSRGLLAKDVDVVAHASGHYTDEDLSPVDDSHVAHAESAGQLATLMMTAASS